MKKLHLLKRTLLLLALIVGCVNYGWAADELFYTLTPATGSNNSYAGNCDVAINGITWNVTGNSTFTPWRIGGKSLSGEDRAVYSKTAMSSATTKVELKVGAASSITVNSLKLIVASDAAFNSQIDEVSETFTANSTITFTPSPTKNWTSGAYYKFVFNVTVSGSSNKFVEFSEAKFYKEESVAYEITAVSNNEAMGTVSIDGSTITASPKPGYRYADPAYTVSPANSATVSQNGDNFTVTPSATTTVTINFEAIPTYTVTFNAEGGTCGTTSATETIGGAGVTLPTATTSVVGWEFAGWATAPTASTTTRPTLYKSGSTYYPTANVNLHAVYTLEDSFNKFAMATSNSDIVDGANVVISSLGTNKYTLANNSGTLTGIANFTPTDGIITCSNTQAIWTLDISDGKVTIANGGKYLKRSSTTVSADEASSNWTINESNLVDNRFLIKDETTNYYLEHNGTSWIPYNTTSITQSNTTNYIGLTIYVEMANKYDSNPTQAVVTPVVEFNSTDAKTLYLDGTITYTNAASVTGVDKPITYSSSDVSVATVNASGVVTAVGIGTATITASVAAELGVNKAASDTYEITVKNTTTIAGLKALYDAAQSPAKAFAADLTDAVVTYVYGNHAYIQDATGAIYASCGSSLTAAGKKINGAVSGTITAPNTIDEIKTIDISAATVTEDGVIPAAAVKTLAEIKAGDYDGKLVTVNGATVKTGMNDATSGGVITDDDNVTTFNIIAPNKLTLNATEEGNFTAFVSIYGGSTYRLNIYEASQFVKTRNVATAQPLAFAEDAVKLDEVTPAFAAFTGQAVSGAIGEVSYAMTGDAIGSVNASTGIVTLNGACGTATITATAAAKEVTEAGVTTPYTETAKSYTVTVNPRYMVTFSVNGVETVLRQATSGASIAVPTPDDFGDYKFMGWSTSTVDPINVEPSMTALGANVTPEDNDDKYYAVFAQEGISGSGGSYTLDYANEPDIYNKDLAYATETNLTASDGGSWVIHAYSQKNNTYGLQINKNKGASIKVPSCPSNITSIEVTCKSGAVNGVGFSSTASGSSVISVSDGTSQTLNLTGKKMTDGYIIPVNGNAIITNIVVNYGPIITYSDYRTSLPTVEVTITDAQYATFCYARELNVEGTGVTAYTASANGEHEAVTLTKISNNIIPANTGVILFAESAGDYEIKVSETGKEDEAIASNELVGVTARTQIPETSADKYNYIFSKKDDVIGFYRASGAYLLPNRAYLSTSTKAAAAREFMAIMFDEGETSLREVRGLKAEVRGEFFNLNGQRVATPVKGNIYIVNGKKVMFK